MLAASNSPLPFSWNAPISFSSRHYICTSSGQGLQWPPRCKPVVVFLSPDLTWPVSSIWHIWLSSLSLNTESNSEPNCNCTQSLNHNHNSNHHHNFFIKQTLHQTLNLSLCLTTCPHPHLPITPKLNPALSLILNTNTNCQYNFIHSICLNLNLILILTLILILILTLNANPNPRFSPSHWFSQMITLTLNLILI